MLKIKYNVDLKDLEKYPFESSDSGSIFWSNKDCSKHIRVWFHNREIQCNDENNHILKMLKRDELVEKVEKYLKTMKDAINITSVKVLEDKIKIEYEDKEVK